MEYTKGEWKLEGNKVKVSGAGTVAICPSPTNDCGVLGFIANAHLIAAAPDLYEACKKLRTFVKRFGKQRHLSAYPENCAHCQLIKQADEAIATVEKKLARRRTRE